MIGQVIRIWGRTPFIPGPITPPPLQPTEPFWQQVFQQQHQLFPELAPPKPNPPPHPQQQQQANPDPIWRGVMATTNKEPVATNTNTTTAGSAGNMVEDQWPDLGGNRQVVQQQHHKEEERKQRMREAEEAAARYTCVYHVIILDRIRHYMYMDTLLYNHYMYMYLLITFIAFCNL